MNKDKKKKKPEYTARQKAIYRSVALALRQMMGTKEHPLTRDLVRKKIKFMAGMMASDVPKDFMDLADRDMRRAISTGRKYGEWPCILSKSGGKDGGGYYLASNDQEIEQAIEHMRSYLIDEAWNLAGLRASLAHARGTPLFPAYEGE